MEFVLFLDMEKKQAATKEERKGKVSPSSSSPFRSPDGGVIKHRTFVPGKTSVTGLILSGSVEIGLP